MARRESEREEVRVPGTVALTFIFLAWFVFFYFLAWWTLSGTWPVR